jgi:hypothetical protein
MTRALALLARGDWSAALALHPWAPVVAAQLGLAWVLWGTALLRPGAGAGWRSRLGPVLAANLAALAALWLGRLASGTLPL